MLKEDYPLGHILEEPAVKGDEGDGPPEIGEAFLMGFAAFDAGVVRGLVQDQEIGADKIGARYLEPFRLPAHAPGSGHDVPEHAGLPRAFGSDRGRLSATRRSSSAPSRRICPP